VDGRVEGGSGWFMRGLQIKAVTPYTIDLVEYTTALSGRFGNVYAHGSIDRQTGTVWLEHYGYEKDEYKTPPITRYFKFQCSASKPTKF
jgi:hypothetical protein